MNRQHPRAPLAFFLALIAIGGVSCAARVHAATTVALVSTCGGQAGQDVLALAETALSAEEDIALVERREVERVLQEQDLMHCGLSEAAQAVAAGQLLGVQVFASLETVPDEKEALGLVVFDAATGVVLWDSVLHGTNVEQAAAEVDAAVKAGCEKRQRPAGSLTRVCILSVRNVDLPREFDSSCQSVGSLLQRQLVQSPSLAVLERQHLENANKERLLPAAVQTNQLLPSLVLIDLDISRNNGTKGLSGMATLSDTAGAKLGRATATVESGNPADLSDQLLIELEKLLKATPSRIVVDRAREAERFYREANFLLNSGKSVEGLRAFEAANALVPTNMEYQQALAICIAQSAGGQVPSLFAKQPIHNLGDSLDLARRALEISRAFHERVIASTGTTADGPEQWLIGGGFWTGAQLKFQELDPDIKDNVLEFQRQLRELVLGVVEPHARAQVKDQRSFEAYTELLRWRLCNLEKLAPSSSVWTADTVDCLRAWLKMAEKFTLNWNNTQPVSARMLVRLCYQVKGPWGWAVKPPGESAESNLKWTPHINYWKLQTEDYARFDELFREMERHPDPVVAAYGLAGQLSSKVRDASSTPTEVEQQYQRAKKFFREQISASRRGPATQYRGLLYNAAVDLIDQLPDPQTRRREYQSLFEFMLDRKEIEYWVTRKAASPRPQVREQYQPIFGPGGTFDSFDAYQTLSAAADPQSPVDYTKLAANVGRVLSLLRSGGGVDIDTAQWCWRTGSFERELVSLQCDLKTEPGSKPSAPWESAKLLFHASGQFSNKDPGSMFKDGLILSVATDSNDFYVVLSGPRLRVVRVPMDGGQPVFLGEALYQGRGNYGKPFVTIPVIGEQKVFVGTNKGIFVFPLEGGTAQHITTAEGLPTDEVRSLACLDGKLYAGLWGGYLIAYDLETGECQVLASSQRHDAHSSLDNVSPPTDVEFMMPDPDRHRILFTVSVGPMVPCAPQLGLWQIDTPTGKLTQLVQLYSPPIWANLMGDGTMLIRFHVYASPQSCDGAFCGVVSYELATGRTRFLSVCDEKQRPAGPKIPVPEGVLRLPLPTLPPHIFVDGWLWFANGRVSTNAADLEYFPESEETQGIAPYTWKSFHPFRDRGQIAIAGPNGIWLLTLKKHEGSADTSKVSP
jgi:hypothetical protein